MIGYDKYTTPNRKVEVVVDVNYVNVGIDKDAGPDAPIFHRFEWEFHYNKLIFADLNSETLSKTLMIQEFIDE